MVGAKSVETDVLMGNPRSFAAEITRKGRDRFVDAIVIPHRQVIIWVELCACVWYIRTGRSWLLQPCVCVCVVDLLRGAAASFPLTYTHPTRHKPQGIYFMADSYEHFLKEMVIKATTTVVLLVNPAASTHNILPVAGACPQASCTPLRPPDQFKNHFPKHQPKSPIPTPKQARRRRSSSW